MNLKDALKRLEELERKVKELESRPAQQHFHYHHQWQQPVYAPQPPYVSYPQPWWAGQPTWVGGGGMGSISVAAGSGLGIDHYPGH